MDEEFTEIIKLIIQFFQESSEYSHLSQIIESHTQIHPFSEAFHRFTLSFFTCAWSKASQELDAMKAEGFEDLMLQAQFYYQLANANYKCALELIRKASGSIPRANPNLLHKLCFELVQQSEVDWEARQSEIYEAICDTIPTTERIPKERLKTLLKHTKRHDLLSDSKRISLLRDTGEYLSNCPASPIYCLSHKCSMEVLQVQFAPNAKYLASSCCCSSVCLWECQRFSLLHRFQVQINSSSGRGNLIQWSPNSELILSGSADGTVKIWSMDNFCCLKELRRHREEVTAIAWTSDSKFFFTASLDGYIYKFANTGVLKDCWNLHTKITDMSIDSHKEVIYFLSRNRKVFQFKERETPMLVHEEPEEISSISISHLEPTELLICQRNGLITLMKTKSTHKQITSFMKYGEFHVSEFVQRAAFAPCGHKAERWICVPSAEGKVYVWNRKSAAFVGTLGNCSSFINAVSWSASPARLVACACDDGTVR